MSCDPIGPGVFVVVLGASGVGKDSLIEGARRAFAGDHRIVFPGRVVTRMSTAAEEHGSMTDREFDVAEAEGAFALTWRAHGLRYGIPTSAAAAIAEGFTVVANGSRTVADRARERFSKARLVLVECAPDIRAARLALRGRETAAEIEARLGRTVSSFDPARADLRIDNSGPLAWSIGTLVAYIEAVTPARPDVPIV